MVWTNRPKYNEATLLQIPPNLFSHVSCHFSWLSVTLFSFALFKFAKLLYKPIMFVGLSVLHLLCKDIKDFYNLLKGMSVDITFSSHLQLYQEIDIAAVHIILNT